jgi:chromosomal replication initiation ATPase DnaA
MSEAGGGARQLRLDFPEADPGQRPLIETDPYRAPLALLRRWRDWPGGQLALVGEHGAGKSRLLRWWAEQVGAAVVTGADLAGADIEEVSGLSVKALAVDDADGDPRGEGLLAALNLGRSRGAAILLSGRGEPARWFSTPLDLRSRMQAMPVVSIGPPDEETLKLRLVDECANRFVVLAENEAAWLAERMERSWPALGRVADALADEGGDSFSSQKMRKVLISLGMAEE